MVFRAGEDAPAKIFSAPCAGMTRIRFEGSPAVAGLSALRLPC
jgi:hypothetical protein